MNKETLDPDLKGKALQYWPEDQKDLFKKITKGEGHLVLLSSGEWVGPGGNWESITTSNVELPGLACWPTPQQLENWEQEQSNPAEMILKIQKDTLTIKLETYMRINAVRDTVFTYKGNVWVIAFFIFTDMRYAGDDVKSPNPIGWVHKSKTIFSIPFHDSFKFIVADEAVAIKLSTATP